MNQFTQFRPRVLLERILRMRVAHPQFGERVSVSRRWGGEHTPPPLLDHRTERVPGLTGVTLGSREKLVVDVERGLRASVLPMAMNMGKQCSRVCVMPSRRVRPVLSVDFKRPQP